MSSPLLSPPRKSTCAHCTSVSSTNFILWRADVRADASCSHTRRVWRKLTWGRMSGCQPVSPNCTISRQEALWTADRHDCAHCGELATMRCNNNPPVRPPAWYNSRSREQILTEDRKKTSVRVASAPSKIQTVHLPNTSLQRYCYTTGPSDYATGSGFTSRQRQEAFVFSAASRSVLGEMLTLSV
jgi:hypothetical protein